MTIALDTEIVSTRHDKAEAMNHYTITRNGKHWTVSVPDGHLNAYGASQASKDKRRQHVARLLEQAMLGPSDEERKK